MAAFAAFFYVKGYNLSRRAVFFKVKTFTDTIKLFFVFCGAVLGAGFLSGGELVAFFSGKDVICLALSGAVFFAGFAFFRAANDGFTKCAFIAADFVFSAAMLSGLDEIAALSGLNPYLPAASVLSLLLFHFLLSKDIKKVEKVNCALIPLSVAIIFAAVFAKNTGQSAPAKPLAFAGAKGAISAILYACMNIFVALPAASLAKRGKTRSANIAAALCFSVFCTSFALIIVSIAPSAPLPLMVLAEGTAFYPLVACALFIGSFTSLICYLYPLKNLIYEKTSEKKRRNIYCFLLYSAAFLLSRAGISAIIRYLYPVIGALGLFSIVKSFFCIKRGGVGDTIKKRSALCRERKRPKSKNSPKKNTAII